jgi:hypothetical protein
MREGLMPAYVNPHAKFTVSFFRDGELLDDRTAETNERALKAAITLLAELDGLQHGDRLTVVEA